MGRSSGAGPGSLRRLHPTWPVNVRCVFRQGHTVAAPPRPPAPPPVAEVAPPAPPPPAGEALSDAEGQAQREAAAQTWAAAREQLRRKLPGLGPVPRPLPRMYSLEPG